MVLMRRFPAALLVAAVRILTSGAPATGEEPRPVVPASSSVLMDANSGVVLFDLRRHERRPMASTTKIMTALVALEGGNLQDTVVGTTSCTSAEGSSLGLTPGERIKLEDLLAAMMLKSANDAALAIAEHVSGSVEAFVARMNQRAQALGARDSHFVNPNGLHDPDHYSSAYDLALITREAMKHPRFLELVSTKAVDIARSDLDLEERIINHNKLLWRDDTVDGVKTGYVKESGHCLVASATRDEWQLIAVVLGAPSAEEAYSGAQALLDYGFRGFHQKVFARRGDAVGRARVAYGERRAVPAVCQSTLSTVFGPGLAEGGWLEVEMRKLAAPVNAGQVVGEARLLVSGRVVGTTRLLAAEASPRSWATVAGVWALRALGILAVLAVLVRTNAQIVKAYRRRGRRLAAQGRGAGPSGTSSG